MDAEYQEIETMSPSFNHGYFQLSLGTALRNLGKYVVVTAVTIDIDGKPYIPDVLVYPKRKVSRKHDIIQMTEMPLLAVEILSPTQGTKEILDKFEAYFAAGVRSCWLVEPVMGVVSVHSSLENAQTFSSGDVVDDVLDIRLPLAEIFR
jgi:Uma2 family endonuclease